MDSRIFHHTILKGNELHIEANNQVSVHIILSYGNVEIFGSIMSLDRVYNITGKKISLFAQDLSGIRVYGAPTTLYCTSHSILPSYYKIYEIFEERWALAKESRISRPHVLVTGSCNSGKASLLQFLCNIEIRMGWKPITVDLNNHHGLITLPGCVAVVTMEKTWAIEGVSFDSPIVFFCGCTDNYLQKIRFKILVERLAYIIQKKYNESLAIMKSSILVNTNGIIRGIDYENLLHQIETLKCNIIIVSGHDKLYSQLSVFVRSKFDKSLRKLDVLSIKRANNLVIGNKRTRHISNNRSIEKYFFGSQVKKTSVYSVKLCCAEIHADPTFTRVNHHTKINVLTLPISFYGLNFENRIMAVSHASVPEEILVSNIAGFIKVLASNSKNKLLSYLTPCYVELPGQILIEVTAS